MRIMFFRDQFMNALAPELICASATSDRIAIQIGTRMILGFISLIDSVKQMARDFIDHRSECCHEIVRVNAFGKGTLAG